MYHHIPFVRRQNRKKMHFVKMKIRVSAHRIFRCAHAEENQKEK